MPGLDGLRGLAVLAVMACHAGVPRMLGGLVGVDIFFVISGFLITGIVLDKLEANRFQFISFYRRRAFRILPALWLMLAILAAATWLLPVPWKTAVFWQSLLYAVPCATQVQLLRYEDAGTLSHLWSLSVEALFYVLWPLLLVAAYRWRMVRPFFLGVLAAIIACMVARYVVFTLGRQASFFLNAVAVTRADGIWAGAVLCWSLRRMRQRGTVCFSLAAVFLPAALIMLMLTTRPDPSALGWICTLAVAAAASVIALAAIHPAHPTIGWLESIPLRWTGEISYGLYLWHLPVQTALKRLALTNLQHWLAFVTLSFALAAASYYLIERRFLARR